MRSYLYGLLGLQYSFNSKEGLLLATVVEEKKN